MFFSNNTLGAGCRAIFDMPISTINIAIAGFFIEPFPRLNEKALKPPSSQKRLANIPIRQFTIDVDKLIHVCYDVKAGI
jgi:hypothetical protein